MCFVGRIRSDSTYDDVGGVSAAAEIGTNKKHAVKYVLLSYALI